MAHGKETPRQKMIGMMYLVLTAMLALNVSSEVLEAFVLVDNGLARTTENYRLKNKNLYNEFSSAYSVNPVKVGPYKQKADEIQKRVEDIYGYVADPKKEIVIASEGEDSPALEGDVIKSEFINGKSDLDKAATILIGIDGNGKAKVLKQKLEEFREYIISIIDEKKAPELIESIRGILNTDDPPVKEDGTHNTWESARFEHIPLIAVIPQLTKVQVDILNVEAEVLNYLLGSIGATDFKFNKLEATVIPNSNIIFQGSEFRAQIFLAASDTTQVPKVYLCRYDSTFNKLTNSYDYEPVGSVEDIPVNESGKALLIRKASRTGVVNWQGLIEMKAPDGTIVRRPFKHSYTVMPPNVVIAATKMNVLYRGVDNPVDISVPGFPPDKISPTISSGSIKRVGLGSYIVQPGRGVSTVNIAVYAENEGRKKVKMGTKTFRVKNVPPPTPRVLGVTGKVVDRNVLEASLGVVAEMPRDFDFDLKFKVVGFKLSATVGGFLQEQESKSSRFTEEQKRIIRSLRPGSQVVLTDVKAVGPSGDVVDLNDLVLKIR
ncbi:type IX secretion system motor protein PorM/GldM [Tenuifilum thalassicum]|uniref:Gliding motility protein GldM n=1 Tax=Tenuifilum thalassicum TaxID=2590900 RepID=A0A7D3XJT4_9BACT|nr:gliding motility protein GldM [Tenuifilum thalassicum]QKG78855.1 gliding motility protein GldM [Tenuifilum thalassicum]